MNSINSELWRATHNRMLFLSLLAGCLISFMDVMQTAAITLQMQDQSLRALAESLPASKSPAPNTAFLRWMSVGNLSLSAKMFFLIWPILAALPCGSSLSQDRQSGYYEQVVVRCGRSRYFLGKFTVCFMTGGVAVSLPLVLNLMMNAMIYPICVPQFHVPGCSIGNGYFLAELLYTEPWFFCAAWCGIAFLWGGGAASLCLVIDGKIRNNVVIMLFPLVVLWAASGVLSVVSDMFQVSVTLSPLSLVRAAPLKPNPWWVIFPEILLICTFSAGIGYWNIKKHELT